MRRSKRSTGISNSQYKRPYQYNNNIYQLLSDLPISYYKAKKYIKIGKITTP